MNEKLRQFNKVELKEATRMLLSCCANKNWANAVVAARPFDDFESLRQQARDAWAKSTGNDKLEAFAAHPLIGDVELLRARFGNAGDRANAEQGQVLGADDLILEELADLNIRYQQRHGFIFIVFASGKSAEEMLGLLRERINRSTMEEMEAAAAEQMKITELRLTNLLAEED
ncbi:MAG: 2-oxo-4-hydroxy-4-carboxy-5-ureidoimidazoline decarboxylase [Pseudomonadota bacterium]